MTTVYTMNIDDYWPELCEITLPTIRAYAERLGAKLEIIEDRKFPGWPVTYEKMQLFDRSKDDDFSIFIDADTVVSASMPDLHKIVGDDMVGIHQAYNADEVLPHEYFIDKDGRNVGVVANLVAVPKGLRSIWTPFEFGPSNVSRRLACTGTVLRSVDEFCISRNLARYSIGFMGLASVCEDKFLHLDATTENDDVLARAKNFLISRADTGIGR